MKVLHVISGIGQASGGPSRSSQGLVAAECRAGVDAWIYSFDCAEPWVDGVKRVKCDGNVLSVEILKQFDLIHIHGLWDLRLHRVAKMCRKAKVPYIVAPRGMLEPWSLRQKWLKKRIARWLYQDRDLHGAAALHATAESEAEQFRRLGFKNPIIISPNGVNVPEKSLVREKSPVISREKRIRRMLFVSRMHPKKGVLELVEAWKAADIHGWQCELVYTLNGETERTYEAQVKAKVAELGIEDSFIFTGPLGDDEKWNAYARADVFVLPTYSENFGIVVAEALYAELPVITTKGTPWQELESNSCGWWIDLPPKESLVKVLRMVKELPDETLQTMGVRGRKLVEEKYTWQAVCKAMVEGYRKVL